MNSLLAQLLRQYKTFYLSEIEDLSNLDTQNIKQLLRIFKELIEQLPEEVIVFCTLNSLSMYESAEF
jgi:ABC-type enterochelin transport system ATPase subunit